MCKYLKEIRAKYNQNQVRCSHQAFAGPDVCSIFICFVLVWISVLSFFHTLFANPLLWVGFVCISLQEEFYLYLYRKNSICISTGMKNVSDKQAECLSIKRGLRKLYLYVNSIIWSQVLCIRPVLRSFYICIIVLLKRKLKISVSIYRKSEKVHMNLA